MSQYVPKTHKLPTIAYFAVLGNVMASILLKTFPDKKLLGGHLWIWCIAHIILLSLLWSPVILTGCLQVIPGSHKGPLYSHYQDGAFVSAITDPALDPSSAVHIELPAGGVAFFHAIIVHGSSENWSDRSRRMMCCLYSSADNWPLIGVAGHEFTNHGPVDWERYCSTVLKGKPSVFPRMQALPVGIPVPFDAGYDIFLHSKSSDVRQPIAWHPAVKFIIDSVGYHCILKAIWML